MRSFFNCTNATWHVNPVSNIEGTSSVQAPPRKMNRVEVEDMLIEYVRDGVFKEKRMEVKKKMLACFDEIHSPTAPSGWHVKPLNFFSRQPKQIHLDLKGFNLKALPENLGFLNGVSDISLSHNRLQKIPDSIGAIKTLRHLNLSGNLLQALPESIRKIPKLRALLLGDNIITNPPEWLWEISTLKKLTLCDNGIERLPQSFSKLQSLKILGLDYNCIQNLEESICSLSQLEQLHLRHSELPGNLEWLGSLTALRELYLSDNQLQALPESIGTLSKLEYLNVERNRLTELPQSLVCLPVQCNVKLFFNPLSLTVINQLQHALLAHHALNPVQGPSIRYDMRVHNLAVVARPLSEEIASWRAEGGVDSSVEAQQIAFQAALGELSNTEATALSGQLARMRVTAHYKKAPQDLVQRINAFLNYVEQAPDLLQYCASVAVEGTVTCDDRIALAFIELEEAVVHHQSLSEPNLAKLVETTGGLHKSQLLQTIAQQKVSTLVGFVDPTEIILKYVVNLSKEFSLPSQLDDMIFHHCARQVSNADIRHARREIKKQATEANLNTFLANWHPWQQALKKQYPSEYAQVQAVVKTQQEEMHEKMDRLTDRLTATKASHGQLSPQYLDLQAQSNALKAGYRNIETTELVKLTQQARQQLA